MDTVSEEEARVVASPEQSGSPPRWRTALAGSWEQVKAGDRYAQDVVIGVVRTWWELECRGQLRLEAGAGAFLVLFLLPALVAPVQATRWCVRWREITDELTSWGTQMFAGGGLLIMGWFAWIGMPWWFVVPLSVPSCVLLAFGVGRLTYKHTTRGAARGQFGPKGWADYLHIRKHYSAHAVRQSALYTRPSVKVRATRPGAPRHSDVLLARVPVSECGTWVGNTAIGPPFPIPCYTSVENGILILAAPRKAKTATMTRHVWKAPGAALSTQTKPGTYHDTWVLRQEHSRSGRGVHLLDPEHTTGHKSTFWWAAERGCRVEKVARQRAGAFIGAATKMGEDGPILQQQAAVLLRALLCLADLIPGKNMRDVYAWSTQEGVEAALTLMQKWRDQMPHGWASAARAVVKNPAVRTVGAVFIALGDAVGFMADSDVAALCVPPPDAELEDGDTGFDVRSFLADHGTVYLIATERTTDKVGPLLAAFSDYVVEESKQLANNYDRERLDPPLHLSLDEAANTITVPLPQWMSDTGGRGIQAVASLQSRSQAVERWGEAGAETLWNAATVKLIAGGLQLPKDLAEISQMVDTRTELLGAGESVRKEKVPVLTPSEIRRIPRSHFALIHDDAATTIVHVPGPWRDPAIIAARLRGRMYSPPGTRHRVIAATSPAPALPAADHEEAP